MLQVSDITVNIDLQFIHAFALIILEQILNWFRIVAIVTADFSMQELLILSNDQDKSPGTLQRHIVVYPI